LRVITWPMGFIIVAMNRQKIFIAVEVAWAVVNVALSWYCVTWFGLTGAGIAFFASYVFHALLVYPIVRRMSGFAWSSDNLKTGGAFLLLAGLSFTALQLLPSWLGYTIAVTLLGVSGVSSVRSLLALVNTSDLPRSVLRVLAVFRPGVRGIATSSD